jgi:hypothetical protein
MVRTDTIAVGFGGVLVGRWADRREPVSRIGHWPATIARASLTAMAISTHRRGPRLGLLAGGSVFGGLLIAAGLGMAYLALATPLTSVLSANQLSGAGRVPTAFGWSLCLVAGGALLLAGMNRLVTTVGRARARDHQAGPGARALASMPAEVDIVTGVVPTDGQAISELAIGPFGAAVIYALPSTRKVRNVDGSWLSRTRDGWLPMENPIELAMRDAERVRRWLSTADLDFVVRVHAAMIVNDQSIPRSTSCAVITADRLPAWIAALPRQRSLTDARRLRLRALAASSSRPRPN